jgi:hypothetical protein
MDANRTEVGFGMRCSVRRKRSNIDNDERYILKRVLDMKNKINPMSRCAKLPPRVFTLVAQFYFKREKYVSDIIISWIKIIQRYPSLRADSGFC